MDAATVLMMEVVAMEVGVEVEVEVKMMEVGFPYGQTFKRKTKF